MPNEPWYESVSADTPITQGDLIFNCPILSWTSENIDLQGAKEDEVLKGSTLAVSADVVVMTQACDLENEKVSNIIICPQTSINEYYEFWQSDLQAKGQNPTPKAWKSHCNDICDGFIWNMSMLNKEELAGEMRIGIRIVNFHEVFTIPRSFLESLITQRGQERFRLLPPYREHLSQAFARFFMRVGLPLPIEKNWELQR
ncbi:MAG: hypothetical protein ACW99Q_21600 [Candidatus Kariarchaeaceae archaeon]|jgi:hypothetical protein